MNEIWKSVYDTYLVSNLGRIKKIGGDKILSPFKDRDGYLVVNLLFPDRSRKRYSVARLVATAFIPNLESKPVVNHKNGYEKCNNSVENLEWATVSENTKHAFDTGLITHHKTRARDQNGRFL